MLNFTSKFGGCVAIALLFGMSSARAGIEFCNEFPHRVFVAIAYPQNDEHWLSRGWLELATGDCAAFDTAIHVSTFYYRGESDPYRSASGKRVHDTWGNDRSFAIWEKDNFQYYDAEERVLKSTLEPFSKGVDSMGDEAAVTVTFHDGGTTVRVH